ncbi:MAG TPA: TatD family hydrolase [Terracidiphilus sp.]|nr:TatD family hydrolase [Terracidiphilus sp.]
MLIDSHAHIDSPRYADDRADMLGRAFEAGVGAVLAIGIGEGPAEMQQALDICRQFNGRPNLPHLFASAGVYPHNTHEADDAVLAKLDSLLAEPEVIACGEIGLDYYHEGSPHDVQRRGLIRQLEIAAARKRPILIHCRPKDAGVPGDRSSSLGWKDAGVPGDRSSSLGWKDGATDAWDDLFEVLEEHWKPTGLGGVMHCFGGGWEQARRSLDLGFLVSFAGNLTYSKAQPLRDLAARMPLDGILVETDAPWLAPMPNRGKRNEPAWVAQTAQVLAGLLNVEAEELAAATTKNFARLFQLGPVI